MRVKIDRRKCVGGGNCVLAAPDVFTQDDSDGLVILLDGNPPPEAHRGVLEAESLCPGRVISIEQD